MERASAPEAARAVPLGRRFGGLRPISAPHTLCCPRVTRICLTVISERVPDRKKKSHGHLLGDACVCIAGRDSSSVPLI